MAEWSHRRERWWWHVNCQAGQEQWGIQEDLDLSCFWRDVSATFNWHIGSGNSQYSYCIVVQTALMLTSSLICSLPSHMMTCQKVLNCWVMKMMRGMMTVEARERVRENKARRQDVKSMRMIRCVSMCSHVLELTIIYQLELAKQEAQATLCFASGFDGFCRACQKARHTWVQVLLGLRIACIQWPSPETERVASTP